MAHNDAMDRECSSCRAPATFLVTALYSEGAGDGRILSYCSRCRATNAASLGVAIPWSVADLDPIGVLAVLYGDGLTKTNVDPSQHLGLPMGPWLAILEMAGVGDKQPAIPDGLLRRHHVLIRERKWQRVLRLSQALWREERGLPIGTNKKGTPVGSWVDLEYSRVSGCNFLTPGIRTRVKDDLATFSSGERVDGARLYSNLLSSQPLCYNLFAELADDLDLATTLLQTWWTQVQRVHNIRFEFSPGRGDERFTGTRSAFDVFVEYESLYGKQGFIGIEMKYHERLDASKNNAVRERPVEVALGSDAFRDARNPALSRLPLSQLFLDHTLALSMVQDPSSQWDEGHFALIYPSINRSCSNSVLNYRQHLTGEAARFSSLKLEEVVDRLSTLTDTPWVRQLKQRYLQQWPMQFAGLISRGSPA